MKIPGHKKSGLKSNPLIQFIFFFSIVVFFVSAVDVAFGAEGAAHTAEWKGWLWKVINFAVLVFILVKFLGKPLKTFLRQRTELIENALKEAKEARALAEKALAEVEDKLRLKDRELQAIMTQTEESAKKEQDLLIKQGELMRDKILEQAKNNIAHDLKLAKDAIKAEAIELSIELAEKELKEKLHEDRQFSLVEESLARMESKN